MDDLTIECELAAISRDGEQVRYLKAKQRLVSLLDLSPSEAAAKLQPLARTDWGIDGDHPMGQGRVTAAGGDCDAPSSRAGA